MKQSSPLLALSRLNARAALALAMAVAATVPQTTRAADAAKPAAPRYIAKELGWSLKLPSEETVIFQGVVSHDAAGLAPHHILYPAPNVAVAVVALIAHGLTLETARNAQKTRMQEAADRVLESYKPMLANFKYRPLMQQALEKTTTGGSKRLAESTEKPRTGLTIESLPVFSMTQDHTAIVLDNTVVIHAPNMPSAPAYKNIIRVVSRAAVSTDIVKHWNDNDGAALKTESARLLAESLDLALEDVAAAFDANRPQRTVRYTEGRAEKMERGEILKEYCGRIALKNLRGWLMSVAGKSPSDGAAAGCNEGAQKQAPPPDLPPPQQPPADLSAPQQPPAEHPASE